MNGEAIKFDYNLVADLIAQIEADFNEVLSEYQTILAINDVMTSSSTMDSPSGDAYREALEDVINNYLKLSDLKINIIGYLNMVQSNYSQLENSTNAIFANFMAGNIWG